MTCFRELRRKSLKLRGTDSRELSRHVHDMYSSGWYSAPISMVGI